MLTFSNPRNAEDPEARALFARIEVARRELEAEERAAPALTANLERRYLTAELRAEEDDTGRKILRGYAAKFNSISLDLGGFIEQLAPGCFARSLRERPDILMLSNHDTGSILARTSARNLSVKEDTVGLAFRAELPDTSMAADVFENVQCGNIRGMSFGMRVRQDNWADSFDEAGVRVPCRTVLDCDLLEISATPIPAYPQTDVTAATRALFPMGIPAEVRSRLTLLPPDDDEQEELKLRIRLALASL